MTYPGDAGNAEDRGQRELEAADSSASSQHGSSVTHHPQGPHKEQVRVSFVPTVAEGGANWASRLSTGLWNAISEASSWAGGQFQLTKERDERYKEVSGHRDVDPVELEDMFSDATSTMDAEEGRDWEDDAVELQDIHLDATSTMEGRKWARKGDDGWWSAISETVPWAGVKFTLTEERDEKYRGTYVTGYPEDDPVQLQDVLQDATGFRILSPFESDDGTREFPVNDLQTVAQRCDHFLFLVESLAEVLQMGDKPSPVFVRLSVFGWPPQQIFSSYYLGRNSTPEERQVLETAERRALRAVRLIVEAAKSGKLNSLRVLRLNGVGLDDAGFQTLSDVITAGHFHSLTSLSLGANPFGSTSAIALAHVLESGKLLRLKVLALTYSCLGDDACEAFEKAMSSGSLEALSELHFQQNDVGDRGAQALARGFQSGRVRNLTKLSLGWNRIGDEGMVALATSLAAGRFLELSILDFRENSFGAKGIQVLARALESGNLNSLLRLSIENGKRPEEAAEPLVAALSVNRELTVDLSFDESRLDSSLSRQRQELVERNRQYVAGLAQAGRNFAPASTSDPGDGDDRGQQNKKAADSAISSQDVSLVPYHPQGPRKEQVRVSIGDAVAERGINGAWKLSRGLWGAISEASSWAGGQFQLTKERDGQCEEVSWHSEDIPAQLQDIFQDATSTLEAEEGRKWEDDPLELQDINLDATSTMDTEKGRKREDDPLELQDIDLDVASTMEAEEGRKWARKGDYGWWSPISEAAPWAGVEFILTEERDEKYTGAYLSGYPEDDPFQLQDILQDATCFQFESDKGGLRAVHLMIEAAKSKNFMINLLHLRLQGVGLDEAGFQALLDVIEAGHLPSLLALSLGAIPLGSTSAIALAQVMESGKLSKLMYLSINSCSLDDDACEAFEKAMVSGNLEALSGVYFDCNDIGDRGAQALARGFQSGRVKNLAELRLIGNRIEDDGMVALATSLAAEKFPELTVLDFRYNLFEIEGIRSLAKALESSNLNSLQKLSIENGHRSEDAAKPLVDALSVNPALTVDLSFDKSIFYEATLRSQQLVERNRLFVEVWERAEKRSVPASSARVYLFGNPQVGKTTLRKTMTRSSVKALLTRETKDRVEPRTRGIEISKLTFKGKHGKNDISLMIWDMAGQDEYHQLHNSFLKDTAHSQGNFTMFLVMCTSQNIQKAEEELKYWLRFISSSVGHTMADPRNVLVVVNKWKGDSNINMNEWENMFLTLSEMFERYLNIYTPKPFLVNVQVKSHVKPVKDALIEYTRETLESKRVPASCNFIQRDLSSWSETTSSFPVLSRVDFDKRLRKGGAGWSEEAVELALTYLNQVGDVIYIDNELRKEWDVNLRKKLVVLDPTWFCRVIMGDIFLTQGMGVQKQHLFRSKVHPCTGSISISSFQDHFRLLVGTWNSSEFHDILIILLWLGLCYKGSHDDVLIPALIDQDGTPEDNWYIGSLDKNTEGQWIMGYSVEHARSEIALAPMALWHKFQVALAQTREFNDRYGGSDFVCGKYFITFKVRFMCVLVEVNAKMEHPTFDHIEVFVKPLLNCQIDDLDLNTRKQCQVDLASEIVEILLDLWTQVCPGIDFTQRAVWPWPISQPRRPKTDRGKDMKVAKVSKWMQEHGVGSKLQRLVGGAPISGDQLLSTKCKKVFLNSMQGNIQDGRTRLSEAFELGLFSTDMLEDIDLHEM